MGKRPYFNGHGDEIICLVCQTNMHNLCKGSTTIKQQINNRLRFYTITCICPDAFHTEADENDDEIEVVDIESDLL